MDPRSPYFVPPPPPPPPPPGPPKTAGLVTLAVTLGVLIGAATATVFLAPSLFGLGKSTSHDDEKEEQTKPSKPKTKKHDVDPTVSAPKIEVLASDPVRGGTHAKVTLVQFSDFQCPFCQRVEGTLDDLLTKYGDDLRIVWKDNPLPFHTNALPAARLAKIAMLDSGPKSFWKLHAKIFANQKDLGTDLETWAADVGVDPKTKTRFQSDAEKAVDASIALAKEIGANGTPQFYIDGEKLAGAQPKEKFEAVIDAHLKEADQLIASGVDRDELYPRLFAKHWEDPEPSSVGTLYAVDASKGPRWGKEDALVTIVVFGDPAHPAMADAMDVSDLVALSDARVVWRDAPSGAFAREATGLLRAVGKKGGNSELLKAIDEMWKGGVPKDRVAFGTDHGLTLAESSAAMTAAATDKGIDDDLDAATEVDVSNSAIFVNGRKLMSMRKADVMAAYAAEKKRAEKRVAAGTARADVYAELIKGGTSRKPKHVTLAVPSWSPSRGPASAKVVIQVFGDFQCPFCKRAMTAGGGLHDAVAAHASDVRIVFRNYALPFHTMAEPAAELAYEAKSQKGDASFFRVHDALFALTGLDSAKLDAIAVAEGLDMTKVHTAMSTHKWKKVLDDDEADAKKIGVTGTPSFLVGDEVIVGAQPTTVFEAAIARAKAKAP